MLKKLIAKLKNEFGLIIIVIGLLSLISFPWIFTRTGGLFHFNTDTGVIGDTIGGITAPISGFLGAILVYLALKEQIKANTIIINQFAHQKKEDKASKLMFIVIEQIKLIREDIDSFKYSYKSKNPTSVGSIELYSSEAIRKIMSEYPLHHAPENGTIKQDFALIKVDNFLSGIDYLLKLVLSSDIYPEDQKNLSRIIFETYDSRLGVYIGAYEGKRQSFQKPCKECNLFHGIPERIFLLYNSIEAHRE